MELLKINGTEDTLELYAKTCLSEIKMDVIHSGQEEIEKLLREAQTHLFNAHTALRAAITWKEPKSED